jgi:O-antigen/teichoic acid export membrane protein
MKQLLKLFSSAVASQVVLSGANFLAGLLLIRHTHGHEYSLYVLVQASVILANTVQGAWLTGPLTVVAARKGAEDRRAMVSTIKNTQRKALLWVLLIVQLVIFVGYWLHFTDGENLLLLAGTTLVCWMTLRREYLRSILLIYSRPHSVLIADVIYSVIFVAGIGAAVLNQTYAVALIIAALCASAFVSEALASRMFARSPGWEQGGNARPALRELSKLGNWSLVGAIIYWAFTQSYSFLLAGRLGLAAVADVNAIRLMLMPAILLTVGVMSLLGPTAATWHAEAGLAPLLRRLGGFFLGIGLLDLIYLSMLWTCRDWLLGTVLRKHVAQPDELLALWTLVAIIALAREILQVALLVLGQAKAMAKLVGLSAVAALLVSWFGVAWWGAPAVLIGTVVGELVNLAGLGLLLRKEYRRQASPIDGPATVPTLG